MRRSLLWVVALFCMATSFDGPVFAQQPQATTSTVVMAYVPWSIMTYCAITPALLKTEARTYTVHSAQKPVADIRTLLLSSPRSKRYNEGNTRFLIDLPDARFAFVNQEGGVLIGTSTDKATSAYQLTPPEFLRLKMLVALVLARSTRL